MTFDLDFADTTRYPPASYAGIIVFRLTRQDKAHVINVVSTLVVSMLFAEGAAAKDGRPNEAPLVREVAHSAR